MAYLGFNSSKIYECLADRAKQIKTKAIVNEDPTEALIRELKVKPRACVGTVNYYCFNLKVTLHLERGWQNSQWSLNYCNVILIVFL